MCFTTGMSHPSPQNSTDINPNSAGADAKMPWHPPTLEEIDYSETEATGSGGVYDFTVYTGSTGP
jgi:hypothetical protein